jgi:hypothetical protein
MPVQSRKLAGSLTACSCICAIATLLQCSLVSARSLRSGISLAEESHTITATASAADRGDACERSIDKVINLCMFQGLNNIGRVDCECEEDTGGGRKWTCTATAPCTK